MNLWGIQCYRLQDLQGTSKGTCGGPNGVEEVPKSQDIKEESDMEPVMRGYRKWCYQ